MSEILLIDSIEKLWDIKDAWDRILCDSTTNTIFQTLEWISSWWRIFGRDHKLRCLVLKEHGEVQAIAPMVLTARGLFRRAGLVGANRPDYADFIVRRERESDYKTLLSAAREIMPVWHEFMLENVPADSPLLVEIEKAGSALAKSLLCVDVCPFICLRGNEDRVLKSLGKQSIRRKLNRIRKEGSVRLRHFASRHEMDEALEVLMKGHARRYLSKDKHQTEIAFHRELLNAFEPLGAIRFAVLELDGRPIAHHLGFSYRNVYHWHKPGFDKSYAELSPGLVLLVGLIEYALKNGYEEFDFLRGDEPFKVRFADRSRVVKTISIGRLSRDCP